MQTRLTSLCLSGSPPILIMLDRAKIINVIHWDQELNVVHHVFIDQLGLAHPFVCICCYDCFHALEAKLSSCEKTLACKVYSI